MKRTSLLLAAIAMPFLTGFFGLGGGGHETVTLTTGSGYQSEGWLYKATENEQPVAVVFLHGKRGNPGSDHNAKFISHMRDAGFTVVAPLMPWSEKRGYDGTREQGLELVDAAVTATGKDKVVVVGHSMGGMGVLQYGAGNPDSRVAGLISVAPGHDPNLSGRIRDLTGTDAANACSQTEAGNGKARSNYPEQNNRDQYNIDATAEYYCSYYSVNHYPDTRQVVGGIKKPLLWVAGSGDRLTRVYEMEMLAEDVPASIGSNYMELPGKHKSVLFENTGAMIDWIKAL